MKKSKALTVTALNNVSYQLTEKEKKFCEVYCQYGVSGIEAVREAGYKAKTNNTAYSIASENLRKPNIIAYINDLYKEYKFTDEDVMREHLYLIKQHHDLPSKTRAIDMYYKKNDLYSPEKQDKITVVQVVNYSNL
jgi:phage terminase small subunit